MMSFLGDGSDEAVASENGVRQGHVLTTILQKVNCYSLFKELPATYEN